MRITLAFVALGVSLSVTAGLGACAQEAPSLQERLFSGQIANIDTLGVRQYVERLSETRTDSAEVYFNIRGEPVAWRAWIDGTYHVYWQPYGRFIVTEDELAALEVFKQNRQLLEMLEGLELVERAAKRQSE